MVSESEDEDLKHSRKLGRIDIVICILLVGFMFFTCWFTKNSGNEYINLISPILSIVTTLMLFMMIFHRKRIFFMEGIIHGLRSVFCFMTANYVVIFSIFAGVIFGLYMYEFIHYRKELRQ